MRHMRIGTHFIGDLSGCGRNYKTWEPLLDIGMRVVETAGMTPLDYCGVTISNGFTSGATLVIILKESHLSIHTWPELGYVAVDLFTCGDKEKGKKGFDLLVNAFTPKRDGIVVVERTVTGNGS